VGVVKTNFVGLGRLQMALNECEQTKHYAKKCFEVMRMDYQDESVSKVFTISSMCAMPGLVNSVRKDNFVTYGLNSRVLDLFFAEDNDEMFQVVAEFIPCNLLIDGEINGDAAYYYDGTVRKGGADWEHSMVACLVANEYDTLTGCFRSGGDIRRFFAELFKNCHRSTELEKTYRRLLPKMQSLVATEGKLSADRAIALIPAHNESAFANCKVVGVIDGDTINVIADGRQVKVRLSKIDAPEKAQGYGQAAKQHLSNMVYGKYVRIVENGYDKYGRLLGEVFVDGINVNLTMVGDGYAWHYRRYDTSAEYASAARRARLLSKGLWAEKSPTPPWEYRHGNAKN